MSSEKGRRLQRALKNLKANTAFEKRYSEPATLEQRMVQMHTPAVSIAVIRADLIG